jgi:hypothetical protein
LASFFAFVAGLVVGLLCGTMIGVLFMAALVAGSRRPPN